MNSFLKASLICLLFFLNSFYVNAQSVIDLGNLEIEGEVRRPMINLFKNPKELKNHYKMFAREIIFSKQLSFSKFELSPLVNTQKSKLIKDVEDYEQMAMKME